VHEIVIPIRKRYNDFFVVEIFIRVFRVVHDKRTSKTIWILAALMAVVPICARLVDLFRSEVASTIDVKPCENSP
jgi:hypothetical protein